MILVQWVKIHGVFLNMSQVSDVQFAGNIATITLLSLDWDSVNDGQNQITMAKVVKLHGKEAMALKWWLDCHSADAIARYENALSIGDEPF